MFANEILPILPARFHLPVKHGVVGCIVLFFSSSFGRFGHDGFCNRPLLLMSIVSSAVA